MGGAAESHRNDHLGFASAAPRAFNFLTEIGFKQTNLTPTLVRYEHGDLVAQVYHGRRSHELGFQIGRGDELFSISEILRAEHAKDADRYHNYVALTRASVDSGVEQLASLVSTHAGRALGGDDRYFDLLRRQRAQWARGLATDVSVRQVRPQAAAAFREGRYREAAELYERILPHLSPAERAKLEVARKRK
ncbi:MAG TPA: hypothetical protein VFU64_06885 [Gaiellaceae bacterium]|nr:hypothetical protein [Gaiellaceae bacterium]